MSFIHPGKLIYLAHPRTASMATERVLADIFGGQKTSHHHKGLDEINGKTGKEIIFTTIRDPLDLMVSTYFKRVNPEKVTFKSFLLNYKHKLTVRDGRLFFFIKDSSVILRFEHLLKDLNKLFKRFKKRTSYIPVVNATKHKPFKTYHNKETIDIMWNFYPQDMELYYEK